MIARAPLDALLVYPKLGTMDELVSDMPLSVLYAATDSVKRGYAIEVLDLRVERQDWRPKVAAALARGVRLVGVSVMTGQPLSSAREVSRLVRSLAPSTPIVWGGPHVTVVPETLGEDFLDYLIRGYGSLALAQLIGHLRGEGPALEEIRGLSFKRGGQLVHNPRPTFHEMVSYQDIPYQLIEVNHPSYARSINGQRVFSMFTALGCPYRCSFCIHPAVYEVIQGVKWRAYPVEEVLGHIRLAHDRYGATYICFLDDTSFVDLPRMRELLEGIVALGLELTLDFRGARVNELDRMDESFLDLMVAAGARHVMVGFESASDRVLKLMKKGITREQILRVNRKLAAYPSIRPIYNFFCGTPGETYADLLETKDAILTILADNPVAYVGFGADWKPIPGTAMLETAVKDYGYQPPVSLDDWIEMDSSDRLGRLRYPWYDPRQDKLIQILQVATFVIDDKIANEFSDNSSLVRLYKLLARLYRPVMRWRLTRNVYALPWEYQAYRLVMSASRWLLPLISAQGESKPAGKQDGRG